MVKKINNIFKLTKVFFKNSFQNPYLINKEKNKINKKSIFLWLIIIVSIGISYLSFKTIEVLVDINFPEIFLNILFLIFNIIIVFQIILASSNVYFFSNDLEYILPLPINTDELLISKFNTILINLYFSEGIFLLFPLIIYGILTYSGIMYYFYVIIVLLTFPILTSLVVSIVMMLLIKLSKIIKNKDIFQIIITLIFMIIMFFVEFQISKNIINNVDENTNIKSEEFSQVINTFNNKIINVNKYFLVLNPSVNLLNEYNKLNSIFELIKIILINFVFLILFCFIGKRYYLKNILNSNNFYYKRVSKGNLENILKKKTKQLSYINKEFKVLVKTPIFFMQCVFPTLILMISLIIILAVASPNIRVFMQSDIFQNEMNFSIGLGTFCMILGLIQMIFSLSNISISAISREGKNAFFMKTIPINLYKQFSYKTIPQILINNVLIFIILLAIKLIFPEFNFGYLVFIFIIATILNILNSTLMVFIDLYKPNLKWDASHEAVKSNNKIFQYVFTIIIILLLVYFNKIFSNINLIIACTLMMLFLIIILIIVKILIKKNIDKLFKKIN